MPSICPTSCTGQMLGWLQSRGRPRLAVEALEQFGRRLLLEVGRLEGDLPLELRVFGEIDHAHRALAQGPDDAVAAELRLEPAPFARTPHGLRGDRLQAVPGEGLRRRDGDVDAIAGRFGAAGGRFGPLASSEPALSTGGSLVIEVNSLGEQYSDQTDCQTGLALASQGPRQWHPVQILSLGAARSITPGPSPSRGERRNEWERIAVSLDPTSYSDSSPRIRFTFFMARFISHTSASLVSPIAVPTSASDSPSR